MKWYFSFFFYFVFAEGNTWNDVDRYISACFGYGQTKTRCCLSNPHRHFIKHGNMYLWNILILCKHFQLKCQSVPWVEGNALSSQARWFVLFCFIIFSFFHAGIARCSNLCIFVKKIIISTLELFCNNFIFYYYCFLLDESWLMWISVLLSNALFPSRSSINSSHYHSRACLVRSAPHILRTSCICLKLFVPLLQSRCSAPWPSLEGPWKKHLGSFSTDHPFLIH